MTTVTTIEQIVNISPNLTQIAIAETVSVDFRYDNAVRIDQCGAVGNGVEDDSEAFELAFESGKPIILGYNKTYRLASMQRKELLNRDFIIQPNGSVILLDNPNPDGYGFLTAKLDYTDIISVSAVGTATIQIVSGLDTDVSYVDVADSSAYTVNDIVKIVSNDFRPGSDPVRKARLGEMVKVSKIDGNRIYFYGLLRETYSLGIRLAKMNTVNKIAIDGRLTIKRGPNCPLTDELNTAFIVAGYFMPYLGSLTIEGWGHSGLAVVGCYEGSMELLASKDIIGNEDLGRFAYGGASWASHGFTVKLCVAQNVRHGWTSLEMPLNENDDRIEYYGRTYGFRVVTAIANNCGHAPWDFHPDAEDCEYVTAYSYNTYRGDGSGEQYGAQMRGKGCKIHTLVTNCLGGVLFNSGGDKGQTTDAYVGKLIYKPDASTADTFPYPIKVSGDTTNLVTNCRVDEMIVDIPLKTSVFSFGDVTNGDMHIGKAYVKARCGVADQILFLQNNSQVTIDDLFLDISESTQGGQKIARLSGNASSLFINRVYVKAGSVNWTAALDFNGQAGSATIKQIDWDRPPSDQDLVISASSASYNIMPYGGWKSPVFGWKVEDHYLSFTLDPVLWLASLGSDGTCASAIQEAANGILRLTFGDDPAANMSANGAQKTSALRFTPSNGDIRLETWFRTSVASSTANVCYFLGFTDTTALEIPAVLGAGDVVTANATECAGIIFDTAANTKQVFGVAVKAGVAQKVQLTSTSGNFSNNGKYNWAVEILKNGNVNFYRAGVLMGSISDGVTASALLCSYEGGFSRSTASKYLEIDATIIRQGMIF